MGSVMDCSTYFRIWERYYSEYMYDSETILAVLSWSFGVVLIRFVLDVLIGPIHVTYLVLYAPVLIVWVISTFKKCFILVRNLCSYKVMSEFSPLRTKTNGVTHPLDKGLELECEIAADNFKFPKRIEFVRAKFIKFGHQHVKDLLKKLPKFIRKLVKKRYLDYLRNMSAASGVDDNIGKHFGLILKDTEGVRYLLHSTFRKYERVTQGAAVLEHLMEDSNTLSTPKEFTQKLSDDCTLSEVQKWATKLKENADEQRNCQSCLEFALSFIHRFETHDSFYDKFSDYHFQAKVMGLATVFIVFGIVSWMGMSFFSALTVSFFSIIFVASSLLQIFLWWLRISHVLIGLLVGFASSVFVMIFVFLVRVLLGRGFGLLGQLNVGNYTTLMTRVLLGAKMIQLLLVFLSLFCCMMTILFGVGKSWSTALLLLGLFVGLFVETVIIMVYVPATKRIKIGEEEEETEIEVFGTLSTWEMAWALVYCIKITIGSFALLDLQDVTTIILSRENSFGRVIVDFVQSSGLSTIDQQTANNREFGFQRFLFILYLVCVALYVIANCVAVAIVLVYYEEGFHFLYKNRVSWISKMQFHLVLPSPVVNIAKFMVFWATLFIESLLGVSFLYFGFSSSLAVFWVVLLIYQVRRRIF